MERIERMEILLERYFEGLTTSEEERELREFFSSACPLPARLNYARAMFRGIEALAAEEAPQQMRETPGQMGEIRRVEPVFEEAKRNSRALPRTGGRRMRLRIWAAGIAAAGVAVGIFALVSYLNRPYCYIDGVAVRDADLAMQATVYFERLDALDKPMERLDGIMEQLKKDK